MNRLLLAALAALFLTVFASAQVTLSWDDNSDNEAGFEIERAVGDGQFAAIGRVGPNVTSFVDSTIAPATTYRYRVAAWNDAGKSGWSTSAPYATRGPVPTDPSGPEASEGPAYTPPTLTLSQGESVKVTSGVASASPKPGKGNGKASAELTEIILPIGDEIRVVAVQ
jgi:hypothetical protein